MDEAGTVARSRREPAPEAATEHLAQLLHGLALLAVDPFGLGGAVLAGPVGPVSTHLTDCLRATQPADMPWRKMPAAISDERLIGGLDLSSTLAQGRPVLRRGLLAEVDQGVVHLPMAERVDRSAVTHLCSALDQGVIRIERDGFAEKLPSRFAVLAQDESQDGDDPLSPALADRLAFRFDITSIRPRTMDGVSLPSQDEILAARNALAHIVMPEPVIEALCTTAAAFGVASLRAPLLAARAARAAAALEGRSSISDEDVRLAATLVIAPRATCIPAADDQQPEPEQPDTPENKADESSDQQQPDKPLEDMILDAVRAALPEKLLAGLIAETRQQARSSGGAGSLGKSALRGRPIGARRGELRQGQRLALLDTLRAAAPWQPIRQRETGSGRIEIRRDDFRIRRFKQQAETTTIFVVDASGSSALNRLAEAKGAIELLLADCYVRRDSVQLIAFRGERAETILPPTRSLVRAKRSLQGLPGGGGTPLATALDAAREAAREAVRRGQTAIVVFLTDGKANICRDGQADRSRAHADASAAARAFSAAATTALFIDTSPRAQPQGREIAAAMRARYLPLPSAEPAKVSAAVRTMATDAGAGLIMQATVQQSRKLRSASAFDFDYPDFEIEGKDWPNRSTSRFVTVGGLEWHVQRMGTGPKLLLIHGTGGASHSFRDLMPLLAQHFEVLNPDLPGHGFTSAPGTESLSLPALARSVGALLKQQAFQPDLAIGHSAGAAILIRMAQQDIISPKAIIGINAALMPFPGLAQKLFPTMARMLVLNPIVPRFFSWTASERAVSRLLEGTGSKLDAFGNDLYRRLFAKSGHAHAALGMMARWELEPLLESLPKLKTPLHLIVGERDRAVPPRDAEALKKRLPSLTITRIAATGHLTHEEAPEATAVDILAVWNRVSNG